MRSDAISDASSDAIGADAIAAHDAVGDTATDATPPRPRYVVGRYLVRVDALEESGLARGRITQPLRAPSAEESALVYGHRLPTAPAPDALSFVGGLSGELVEVELRWTLPRPGRKPAR